MPDQKVQSAEVEPLDERFVTVEVEGIGDGLLLHAVGDPDWDKPKGTGKAKKPTTHDEFKSALYRVENGSCYVPAIMFKKSMVQGGCRKEFVRSMSKVVGNMLFQCYGPDPEERAWSSIEGSKPEPLTMPVRNPNTGNWTMCTRAYLPLPWTAKFTVHYLGDELELPILLKIINKAGFHAGIGAYRRGLSGPYGGFRLVLGQTAESDV